MGNVQTRRQRLHTSDSEALGGVHGSARKDQVLAAAGLLVGWSAVMRSCKASAMGLNSIFPRGPSRRAVQANSVASPTWTTITVPA